jgi:hypothetical protein
MNGIKNQSSALTQQINYWIRYFFGEEIDFARRFI